VSGLDGRSDGGDPRRRQPARAPRGRIDSKSFARGSSDQHVAAFPSGRKIDAPVEFARADLG
jgi:hypothetical protein